MSKSLFSSSIVGAGLALLLANGCLKVDLGDDEVGDDETTGDGDGDSGDGDGDGGDGDGDPGDGDGDPGDGDGDPGDGDGDGGDGDGDGDGDPGDGDGDPGDGDGEPGDGDGDPDPSIEQACQAACETIEACFQPDPTCVTGCIEHHQGFMDIDCLTFELALTECITGLTCPQLEQFMDAVPPYPCQAEMEASCGEPGGECSVGVGQGENPGECSVTVSCENEPEQSVECDGTSCTCYVDNVETGSCANPQTVCDDPTPDALAACCG